jgi:Holliday junction resolvase RusA-like endonuclease
MKYKTKDQMNVLLSHFLNNGLRVISAQLGINRSEVKRMALYNLLKDTYTKQEMDWFAGRDDVVDEMIEYLQTPGHSEKFASQIINDENQENEKDELDDYQELYDNELEERLKPIKKKYAIPYADEFLKKTGMNEKEASEFFKRDFKERQKNAYEYRKEVDRYLKTEYPKERKGIEAKLKQLTGKTWSEMERKAEKKEIDYMISYFQDTIAHADNYMDDGQTVADARIFLKIWQLKKEGKEKEADELLKNFDKEVKEERKKYDKKK